jgi:hypothetical protein
VDAGAEGIVFPRDPDSEPGLPTLVKASYTVGSPCTKHHRDVRLGVRRPQAGSQPSRRRMVIAPALPLSSALGRTVVLLRLAQSGG